MIGNAASGNHQRLFRQPVEEGRLGRKLPAERQHAAMQMKADDAIECFGFGNIDRNIVREFGKDIGNTCRPVGEQQDLFGGERAAAMRLRQHAQHDGALGDEPSLPPRKVTLADLAELRDPRIRGINDRDGSGRHGSIAGDGDIGDGVARLGIDDDRPVLAIGALAVEQDLAARKRGRLNRKA